MRPRTKSFIVRSLVLAILAFCVAFAVSAILATSAKAAPTFNIDPHLPNPALGYCPGGGSGGFGAGYCDGVEYGDGTFWHSSRGFIPFVGYSNTLYCASSHDIIPVQAPNGCRG